MKRLLFNLLFAGLIIVQACQKEVALPPNIIYILVDDLGSADLGCYGSQNIQTPNIDQLAKQGLLFTQAYSGNTVCAPARSTFLTGLHTGHTPVRGNTGGIALPEAAFTIAEMFKDGGYATGGFGKWGVGEIGTSGVPEKQGFDQFFGYYHQIHAHNYFPEYLYENSQQVKLSGEKGSADAYSAYRIFEATKKFITTHKGQPFFCYAPWTVPHGQFVIPEEDPAFQLYAFKDWSPDYKNYAAMVTMMDRHVGEIIDLIKTLGLAENTLVIFSSDNGGDIAFKDYQTNGKLRGFKRDLYEGGIRVPMIVSWPGKIPEGQQTNLPVYFPDLMPTFADVAGLQEHLPKNFDGKTFYQHLLNPQSAIKNRYLYWEYPDYDWGTHTYPPDSLKQALRYDKWKMIRNGPNEAWELYNLKDDPSETDNIAPYHPGKMQKFQEWIGKNRNDAPEQIEPERINGKPYR